MRLERSSFLDLSGRILNVRESTPFYRELAELTDGLHLPLHQFRWIGDLVMGIAYQLDSSESFDRFEQAMRSQSGFNRQKEELFDRLAGREAKTYAARVDGLVAVEPGRFQVFEVEGEPSIRDFVEGRGIRFNPGRGFYPHVSRKELIQERKEVILEDLKTGELFTGSDARELIGLPYGQRGEIKPNPVPGYRCWVQSTS